jgi:hypothetical protein
MAADFTRTAPFFTLVDDFEENTAPSAAGKEST